jgi:DNA-binding response OmpR family regulator
MFEKWKSRRLENESNGEPPLTVLAMTSSLTDASRLRDILACTGWELRVVDNLEDANDFLGARSASVGARSGSIVLFDRDLPDVDWRQGIGKLAHVNCRVILASFVADDYLWEEVIHCGGYDVIAKPFRADEVVHMIQFAWAALTKSLPSAPRTK